MKSRLGRRQRQFLLWMKAMGGEVRVEREPCGGVNWRPVRDSLWRKGLLELFHGRASYGHPLAPTLRLTAAGRRYLASLGGFNFGAHC